MGAFVEAVGLHIQSHPGVSGHGYKFWPWTFKGTLSHCIPPGHLGIYVVLGFPASAWLLAEWRDPWPERVLHTGQEYLIPFSDVSSSERHHLRRCHSIDI